MKTQRDKPAAALTELSGPPLTWLSSVFALTQTTTSPVREGVQHAANTDETALPGIGRHNC
jgi:hypothetical protein